MQKLQFFLAALSLKVVEFNVAKISFYRETENKNICSTKSCKECKEKFANIYFTQHPIPQNIITPTKAINYKLLKDDRASHDLETQFIS